MTPQAQVLNLIRSRKVVWIREIIQKCATWKHATIMGRLKKKGYPIVNVSPPGYEACYHWVEVGQIKLL